MAPDSRLWRHQLGEAFTGLWRLLPKVAVPFFLFVAFSANTIEAKTEPIGDSRSEHSGPILSPERTSQQDFVKYASLPSPTLSTPSTSSFNSSPAGRWSNRIEIPIADQPLIQKHIRFFETQGRRIFAESLERSRKYLPIMTEVLECHGVPPEMIAIVFIESSFRGSASYRGAVGYWQMLASTARCMGLRVDQWVDERLDPIKSTRAAAKYLRSLYEQFGSWTLALAAYNSGAGPVSCAVKKNRVEDFWEVSGHRALPARTKAYVPKVLAAVHILRNIESYGFKNPGHLKSFEYESIWVKVPLKLEDVARWIDVPVSDLQALNPSLCLGSVPPDSGFALRLPSGGRDKFDVAFENHLRK